VFLILLSKHSASQDKHIQFRLRLGVAVTRLRGEPSEIYSESLLAENLLSGSCRLSP
jgi:hypothetical protein